MHSKEEHPGKCCSFGITPIDSNAPKHGLYPSVWSANKKLNAKVPWGTVFTQRKGADIPGRTQNLLLFQKLLGYDGSKVRSLTTSR